MAARFSTALVLLLTGIVVSTSAGPTDHQETVAEHLRGEHNPQFDHEAFLGKSESDKFDELTPQEARRRLSIIVDRIDVDKDGYVTQKELQDWVGHVGKRYIMDDVIRLGSHYDADSDDYITWEEYHAVSFGNSYKDDDIYSQRFGTTFKEAIRRKKKRFALADFDGDQRLTRDELADFLHPDNVPHMKTLYVEERMQDIDRNKDGYITLAEYIDDVWPAEERDKEPEWLPNEKSNFNARDKDGDGQLNFEELKNWLVPANYDPSNAEAVHLIHHADSDMDKKLSKEEILQHQDVFVGSRATEWGSYLKRHDEF